MRAAVPLETRAAALTRPRTVYASTRCAARATARAPAAVTPRPAATSTVAFESASPTTRGRGSSAIAAGVASSTATSFPEVACAVSLGYMAAAFVAYYLGARDPARFARCAPTNEPRLTRGVA